jgi:peptidoglycan/LPS O-acetylase OafA/YrhL
MNPPSALIEGDAVAVPARVSTAAQSHQLDYRADIDGLRAVAVLSVVGFHAFPSRIGGGFAGVDIFFVISGYLISGIIFRALQSNRFSYRGFYSRRIRRIFPALITVLSASLAAGALLLFPSEYQELGRQTAAGAGFVANLLFWSESGYFDAAAQLKPLLHLWSLGIEEQFYIFWPLLLAFSYPRTAKLPWLMAALGLLSFVLNVVTVRSDPVADFYSPLSRFWELLLGASFAHATVFRNTATPGVAAAPAGTSWIARPRVVTEALAWLGAMLVAGSLLLLDESQPFPGWLALPPALGTLCIIANPRSSLNRRVLAWRPLVFVGLISYPLYLWHWVLLTIVQHSRFWQAGGFGRVPLVALSFLLAWLTYELIEKPVRFGRLATRGTAVLAVLCAVVGMSGAVISVTHGAAFRYPPGVRDFAAFEYDPGTDYREDACEIDADRVEPPYRINTVCLDPAMPGARQVVLWGDSHAASLYPGLRALQQQGAKIQIAQLTTGGCPPLLGIRLGKRARCLEYTEWMLGQIELMKPDTVVIGGSWASYARRAGSADGELAALERTVEALEASGVRRVVVFGSLPVWTIAQPNVAIRIWQETGRVPRTTHSYFDVEATRMDARVGEVIAHTGAVFVSPLQALCDTDGCPLSTTADRAVPVTWDTNHLTAAGSRLLVQRVAARILGAPASD